MKTDTDSPESLSEVPMALPIAVETQLIALNANVNRLLTNRARIIGYFDDELGGSIWGLLSAAEKIAVRDALTTDMQTAANNIDAIIVALQAL